MTNLNNIREIKTLRDRGALFVINHSGGKDSQVMTIRLFEIIPTTQVLVIHADLPGADWKGIWEHIKATAVDNSPYEIQARKCVAVNRNDKEKTFFDLVDSRKRWPSPTTRNCTSDLKRGPIEKVIRHYINENSLSGLVVNCMGIRAEEGKINKDGRASGRAMGLDKKHYKATSETITLIYDKRNSRAGREYYQYYPIFDIKLQEIWDTIKEAGQTPHWAYSKGMTRLSCMFCIMASAHDLTIAAKLVPDVYKQYCDKEKELDFTFAMPVKGEKKFLPEITGIDPNNNFNH